MEGVKLVYKDSDNIIVPVSCAILVVLFLFQSIGTERVGIFFGPILFLWVLGIGGIGIYNIVMNPLSFLSWNPYYIFIFFQNHGYEAFNSLGVIILGISGCEAMYSDM